MNITKDLDIDGLNVVEGSNNIAIDIVDPIDKIILNYDKHPSILNIRNNVNYYQSFFFL